ncbi:MAG TPA: TlpA disulfide reductase family protein, partial [Candidatus Binatia bacterium]|nr:TlpA disulfide reductase family protein [Candidatus Binatia bacterium]
MKARLATILLLALMLAAPCSAPAAQPAAQPAAKVNYKLVPNLEPMKDNSPTPDFTVVDPAGKKVSLKDYRGKLVLLNFWATWCVPCREEMPAMERLYEQYKNK